MLGERFDTLSDRRAWSTERALDVQATQDGTSAPANPNSSASIQQCNVLFPSAADGNNDNRHGSIDGISAERPFRRCRAGTDPYSAFSSAARPRTYMGICPSMMHPVGHCFAPGVARDRRTRHERHGLRPAVVDRPPLQMAHPKASFRSRSRTIFVQFDDDKDSYRCSASVDGNTVIDRNGSGAVAALRPSRCVRFRHTLSGAALMIFAISRSCGSFRWRVEKMSSPVAFCIKSSR